jgi:hypothetical protein
MSGVACGTFLVGGPAAMVKIAMSDLANASDATSETAKTPDGDPTSAPKNSTTAAAKKESDAAQEQDECAESIATILMLNFSVGLVLGGSIRGQGKPVPREITTFSHDRG